MYFILYIYKMPTYQYATGQNVSHNGNCCTVFRLRDVDGAPAYLLREIISGTATDNVLETDISDCSTNHVVNEMWERFTYNGNNEEASNYVMNNIVKHITGVNNLEWGPNASNTEYHFNFDGGLNWKKVRG